jgi:serine/threonine protein kinase, bacterial
VDTTRINKLKLSFMNQLLKFRAWNFKKNGLFMVFNPQLDKISTPNPKWQGKLFTKRIMITFNKLLLQSVFKGAFFALLCSVSTLMHSQTVSTYAGTGVLGYLDGNAATAQFKRPMGVATDAAGNVYVCDAEDDRIRKITPAGIVSTLAGSGTPGYQDGTGISASLTFPFGICVAPDQYLYFVDRGNRVIRKVSPTGDVSHFSGSGTIGFNNGSASTAQFSDPKYICRDNEGNFYVTDEFQVRKITPNGTVSTLAGGTTAGFVNGQGTSARFNGLSGICLDNQGNLFVAERLGNNAIRKITPTGLVTTFLSTPTPEFAGLEGMTFDDNGNLWIVESFGHRIRKVTPNGQASIVAGSLEGNVDGYGGAFRSPAAICHAGNGVFYIADAFNYKVRKLLTAQTITIAASQNNICTGTEVTFTATAPNVSWEVVYQWKKNNVVVGSSATQYTHNNWTNGDIISCNYTDNGNNITSNVLTMSVGTPIVAAITGTNATTVGSTTELACATEGGTWSSDNSSIATVSATGVVSGIGAGSTLIRYAVTNPCGATEVVKAVTVGNAVASSVVFNILPLREGNYLYVNLNLLATGSTFRLAGGNLQFAYNKSALSNPTLLHTTLTQAGVYSGVTFTTPHRVNASASEGLASLNFNFTGTTGQGMPITTEGTGTPIALVRFDILQETGSANLYTYQSGTGGTLVYDDLPQAADVTGTSYGAQLNTNISYGAVYFCKSETPKAVTRTGVSGGAYFATPENSLVQTTDLVVNPLTGEIDVANSVAGNYYVYYMKENVVARTLIHIYASPEVSITGLNPTYCTNAPVITLAGLPAGGVFKVNELEATTFNPASGLRTNNVSYSYVDANSCAATASQGVTLYEAVTITQQPFFSNIVCGESPVQLEVQVTGYTPTYQWKRNGQIMPNETNSSLYFQMTSSTEGTYTVEVSNECSAVTSTEVSLRYMPTERITQESQDISDCEGASFTLGVQVVGIVHTYQWFKDNSPISGANSNTYSVTNATSAASGTYYLQITGACHPLTSRQMIVSIQTGVSIGQQPVAKTVCAGQGLSLNVTGTGSNLTYQWYKNNELITGATAATYTVASALATHAGNYHVVLSASCGTAVSSETVLVTVGAATAITTQPVNTTVCENGSLTLNVAATGVNLTYQWKRGTTNIANATAATYSVASVSVNDAATYSVVVTGTCGTAMTSANAVVTVEKLPAAITGASSVQYGETTTLANAIEGGIWSSADPSIATVSATGVVTGVEGGTTTIRYTLTNSCGTNQVTSAFTVTRFQVTIQLKVLLEGSFNEATGLMNDGLRANGLIPLQQPYLNVFSFSYAGTESVAQSVLNTTGNDAIVDWVLVELRDKAQPTTVVKRRAALLQSDGDVVEIDGITPVTFLDVVADDYFIAVRHRNHLGFRTANAVALASTATNLNFTNGSQTTFGTNALKTVGNATLMYAGDGDSNGVINTADKYNVWFPYFGQLGYYNGDFNLDRTVNATDINAIWLSNNSVIGQLD